MRFRKEFLYFILLWTNFFVSFVFATEDVSNSTELSSESRLESTSKSTSVLTSDLCNLSDKDKNIAINLLNGKMDDKKEINIFCKISANKNCQQLFANTRWKYSFSQNFFDPTTDREWNDYPKIRTKNANLSQATTQTFYDNALFTVSLKDGLPLFIYLWNNTTLKRIQISRDGLTIFNIYSDNKCINAVTNKTNIILNNLTLTFSYENLGVIQMDNNFNYSYPLKQFKPTHFAFGSDGTAIWRSQSYGLFASNSTETATTVIDVTKKKEDKNICIAVFVRTCNNSILTLELRGKNDSVVVNETVKKKNAWEELKLITNYNETMKLFVNLEADSCFSHIGDIRNCANDAAPEVNPKSTNAHVNKGRKNEKSECSQDELNEIFPTCNLQQNISNLYINLELKEKKSFEFFYHILTNCSNEWCVGNDQTDVKLVNSNNIMSEADIYGLSDYTVYVGVSCSGVKHDINVEYKNICDISTGLTVPTAINKRSVYEETNESISIRWSEPFPKNGILEKFIINYTTTGSTDWLQCNMINPVKCGIWKDTDFCFTLNNLTNNKDYIIKIAAKNEGVEEISKFSSSVQANTIEKRPESPINLTLAWDDYLNLTINCRYRPDAIGPIRKLHIFVNNTESSFDIPNNTRNYSFKIDASNYSSSNQEIKLQFSNSAGRSNLITQTVIIPPKTPILLDGLIKKTNDSVYLDLNLAENLNEESQFYVYYIDKHFQSEITLNRSCSDLDALEKKINKTISIDLNKNETIYTLPENTEKLDIFLVAFVKNMFESYSRCSAYSNEPIFTKIEIVSKKNNDDSAQSDNTIVIIVVLLLILIPLITTIYMYKTKRISYKPKWIDTFFVSIEARTTPIATAVVGNTNDVALLISPYNNRTTSHVVRVKHFNNYVNNAISNGELLQQYNMMEEFNDTSSTAVGLEPHNIKKNRYKNIIAYDKTRVKFSNLVYSNTSDYINASYINGFNKDKAFIATQAPTAFTIHDFWMMIWQENVQCIVMLCKLIECGKPKCEQYWPDLSKTIQYGGITVTCIESKTVDYDVIIRTFKIHSNSTERELVQIHYEGWLDKDVPLETAGIVNVLYKMRNYENDNPIVVHCSAGVGRTGTLILANIATNMAKATETIDMPSILYDLRQQRTKMVQIFDQYKFAHQVVANTTAPIYANDL